MLKFCGNVKFPESFESLCRSLQFPHLKIMWNYCMLCSGKLSVWAKTNLPSGTLERNTIRKIKKDIVFPLVCLVYGCCDWSMSIFFIWNLIKTTLDERIFLWVLTNTCYPMTCGQLRIRQISQVMPLKSYSILWRFQRFKSSCERERDRGLYASLLRRPFHMRAYHIERINMYLTTG